MHRAGETYHFNAADLAPKLFFSFNVKHWYCFVWILLCCTVPWCHWGGSLFSACPSVPWCHWGGSLFAACPSVPWCHGGGSLFSACPVVSWGRHFVFGLSCSVVSWGRYFVSGLSSCPVVSCGRHFVFGLSFCPVVSWRRHFDFGLSSCLRSLYPQLILHFGWEFLTIYLNYSWYDIFLRSYCPFTLKIFHQKVFFTYKSRNLNGNSWKLGMLAYYYIKIW